MGDPLDAILRHASPDDPVVLAASPMPLDGGRSAELLRLRLSAGPDDLTDRDLVLRQLPVGADGTVERVIQAEVARLGFAAPVVLRGGIVDGRGYVLMPFVEGRDLFSAQGPLAALRRVPPRLAGLMLELHDLDPTPVRSALAGAGADGPVDARARALADLDHALASIDHPARTAVRHWFDAHQPEAGPEVVCHGDLHALNVLVNGQTTVLDWELAALGEPAFDIARTRLLLHAVPMPLPRAVRPMVQRLGRRAAARFEAAYTFVSPVPSDAVRWYDALHAARMVGRLLAGEAGPGPASAVLDAWRPTRPLLVASVERSTGIRLG